MCSCLCLAQHEQCCDCRRSALRCAGEKYAVHGARRSCSGLVSGRLCNRMPETLGKGRKGVLGRSGCLPLSSGGYCSPQSHFKGTQGVGMASSWSRTTVLPPCLLWPLWATLFFPFPRLEVMLCSLLDKGGQTLTQSTTIALAGMSCLRFLIPPHSKQDCC